MQKKPGGVTVSVVSPIVIPAKGGELLLIIMDRIRFRLVHSHDPLTMTLT